MENGGEGKGEKVGPHTAAINQLVSASRPAM